MRTCLVQLALLPAALMISSCSPLDTPSRLNSPTPALAKITCNELSFYLDPALGGGYECVTVPESSSSDIPMDVFIYPSHTELVIENYPLTHTQFPAQLYVYPVERFSQLLPNVLPRRVSDLERLISGGTRDAGELPFLPPIPQTQTFYGQETGLSFKGGRGVRFITEYSDSPFPISNMNIIYTFQGLTDDGKYWVAATLPISNPILPERYDTLPLGYTEGSLMQNFDAYVDSVRVALEAQSPGSFVPSIESLDSFVEGISVR